VAARGQPKPETKMSQQTSKHSFTSNIYLLSTSVSTIVTEQKTNLLACICYMLMKSLPSVSEFLLICILVNIICNVNYLLISTVLMLLILHIYT
jgi:hypothetical protein